MFVIVSVREAVAPTAILPKSRLAGVAFSAAAVPIPVSGTSNWNEEAEVPSVSALKRVPVADGENVTLRAQEF